MRYNFDGDILFAKGSDRLKEYTKLFLQNIDKINGSSTKLNNVEKWKDFAKFLEQNSDKLKESSTGGYTLICQCVNDLINNGEIAKERKSQLNDDIIMILEGYGVQYINDLTIKGKAN